MSENRVPKGVPTGGQFAQSAKGESGVGLAGGPVTGTTLATGVTLNIDDPLLDPTVPTLVSDLGDGDSAVTYVRKDTFVMTGDPVADAGHVLDTYFSPEAVLDRDTYTARRLWDVMEASREDNLLDRVVFLKYGPDGVTAHGRSAVMDDWDEYEAHAREFDAAVVLPRWRMEEHRIASRDDFGQPIYDYERVAGEINGALTGEAFEVVHLLVDNETGEILEEETDSYDDTLNDPYEAESHARSHHEDIAALGWGV